MAQLAQFDYIGVSLGRTRVLCHFCKINRPILGVFWADRGSEIEMQGHVTRLEFFTCGVVSLSKFHLFQYFCTESDEFLLILPGITQNLYRYGCFDRILSDSLQILSGTSIRVANVDTCVNFVLKVKFASVSGKKVLLDGMTFNF